MGKPLTDYTGRCGSCEHFAYYIIGGKLVYRGVCDCANRSYFMNNNRHGKRYRAMHSDYRQASGKACKKYIKITSGVYKAKIFIPYESDMIYATPEELKKC